MLFILLVAFSALFVAGCAAFFSIKGLIVLFSGNALAVGIMASSLELGKLVAASFLHTYWNITSRLLKLYLCVAVFVLMCVTSLGIFGFLTGAYQEHSTRVNTFETKISSLELEKRAVDQATLERSDRIKTLTDLRQAQEQRIQSAGNLKAPREQAYKAIAEANEEIQKKETEVAADRQRSIELDKEISDLKISLDTTTDIGSFKFLASAINTDVDTAVRYFIFTLIFVFDPLAVTLVLALNKLIDLRQQKKEDEFLKYEASLAALKVEEELVKAENKVTQISSAVDTAKEEEEKEKKNPTLFYAEDPVSQVPISEIEEISESEANTEKNTVPAATWQKVLR